MKKSVKIIVLLVITFLNVQEGLSQSAIFPSRETVESLLQKLDECKQSLKGGQDGIKTMQANPTGFSLKLYLATQEQVRVAKLCIQYLREDLDELRKQYPGWFNSPGTVMPLGRGREISASELTRSINSATTELVELEADFDILDEPHH